MKRVYENKLIINKIAVLLCFFLAIATPVFAGNRYVRSGSSGSANGSDWANAYSALPATLVRGDTYYIADGSYGSYTFDDAVSGTSVITIKKATAGNHGTDAGWDNSYGDGQAIFAGWDVYTDYWDFDGQVRNSDWKTGGLNQYGIKVSGIGSLRLDNGAGAGADNVTFRYIDFQAGGRDTGNGDDVVYGLASSKNITFQYCALHDSDRTIWLMRGEWQNLLVEYCYIARNSSNPTVHGEMLSDVGSDYVTFRYNVIEDIEGTGVWAVLNGGGSKSSGNTANMWKLYGNVLVWTAAYNREGVAALFYSANDASNKNWTDNLAFYNNTVIDHNTVAYYGILVEAGSGNVVKNNIFYDLSNATHVGVTCNYNWYYSTPHTGDNGDKTQACSSNCDIFADRTNKNYTLSGINAPDAGDSSIGIEFNADLQGSIRGADGFWDKGAYEYVSNASVVKPSAPSNLQVIVQ